MSSTAGTLAWQDLRDFSQRIIFVVPLVWLPRSGRRVTKSYHIHILLCIIQLYNLVKKYIINAYMTWRGDQAGFNSLAWAYGKGLS